MSEVDYHLLLMRLAWHWQLLDEAQYQCLLQLAPHVLTRLCEIDTTLQQLFAASPLLAELSMTSPHRAFANQTPMQLIQHEGMTGFQRIVTFLCLKQ